ncbi:MAG: hypothetical protein JNL69_12035 [Bacteroidia bacterium]|nr:hypothetical protein [Bacteroidia bacterium]
MKTVKTPGATIHFRDDGILHIHYDDDFLTIEDTKRIFKFTREHSPWEVAPLYLSGGAFSNQDAESKRFNSSREVMKHCSAIAFLSPTLAQQILANFFIKIMKSSVPTKFFQTEKEALDFLLQHSLVSDNVEVMV